MHLLARYPGRIFQRDYLLEQLWEYEYTGGTRTVDVHIRRLRQKLDIIPNTPKPSRPSTASGTPAGATAAMNGLWRSRTGRIVVFMYVAAALVAAGAVSLFFRMGSSSPVAWLTALGAAAAFLLGRSPAGPGAGRRRRPSGAGGTAGGTRRGRFVDRLTAVEETARLFGAIERLREKHEERLQQLAHERATLAAVLQSLADPVIAVDRSLEVVFANPTARAVFAVKEEPGQARLGLAATRWR